MKAEQSREKLQGTAYAPRPELHRAGCGLFDVEQTAWRSLRRGERGKIAHLPMIATQACL